MDPKGSCRIRPGRGSFGEGLPNRSGWMMESDLPKGERLGQIKTRVKKQYGQYSCTIYPVTGATTQSVWKHDPNNAAENPESVKAGRALPLPLDKGAIVPEEEERQESEEEEAGEEAGDAENAPDNDDEKNVSGDEAKEDNTEDLGPEAQIALEAGEAQPRKQIRLKIVSNKEKEKDKTYRDKGDANSEDEEPHPEAVKADAAQEGPAQRRKRRAAKAVASTTPATTVAEKDDNKSPSGKGKRPAEEAEGEDEPKRKKAKTRV